MTDTTTDKITSEKLMANLETVEKSLQNDFNRMKGFAKELLAKKKDVPEPLKIALVNVKNKLDITTRTIQNNKQADLDDMITRYGRV